MNIEVNIEVPGKYAEKVKAYIAYLQREERTKEEKNNNISSNIPSNTLPSNSSNTSASIPSLETVREYVFNQGYQDRINADWFFNRFEATHWLDNVGKPIGNWKGLLDWFVRSGNGKGFTRTETEKKWEVHELPQSIRKGAK